MLNLKGNSHRGYRQPNITADECNGPLQKIEKRKYGYEVEGIHISDHLRFGVKHVD